MLLLEFVQEARRDFIIAGPEGHYPCAESDMVGVDRDGNRCVMQRASITKRRVRCDGALYLLQDAWRQLHGEYPEHTNERGYTACVAAYDQLVLHLNPAQPTRHSTPQEIPA